MKKKVVNYYVYGYTNCDDDNEFPAFQFETKSIRFIYDFIGSCDFDCISIEVIRLFEDGKQNHLNVYKLRELYEVNQYEI